MTRLLKNLNRKSRELVMVTSSLLYLLIPSASSSSVCLKQQGLQKKQKKGKNFLSNRGLYNKFHERKSI
jgi:hypothetical protein